MHLGYLKRSVLFVFLLRSDCDECVHADMYAYINTQFNNAKKYFVKLPHCKISALGFSRAHFQLFH